MEHIGPAHDEAELEVLKAVARQCLPADQRTLDLARGFAGRAAGGPLPITSLRMAHLPGARGRDLPESSRPHRWQPAMSTGGQPQASQLSRAPARNGGNTDGPPAPNKGCAD